MKLGGKDRNMCRHDSPTLGQARPNLALASANGFAVHMALELQRNAAVVASEGHDVQPKHIARQACGAAALSESGNLINAVKIFRYAEAHAVRRGPEHAGQWFRIGR